MGRKARIEEIQVLRGVAFLAVVLQHTIGHYDYQPDVRLPDGVALTLLLLGAKFAVPLFIFITGLVLFYNYDGELHYLDFVRKRIKDIIVPYLVWTVVYVLFNHELSGGLWNGGKQLLLLMFTGKSSYHLWYVVMIFQFYLLFPVFRSAFRAVRGFLRTNRLAMAGIVVTGLLYLFVTKQVDTLSHWLEPLKIPVLTPLFTTYADRNFVYFFYYFILGAVAGLYVERWRAWVTKYIVPSTVVFVLLFSYFVYTVTSKFQVAPAFKINFDDLFLIRPLMALLLISFLPVLYALSMKASEKLHGKLKTIIEGLGNYSYGAYLIHVLMLGFGVQMADAWLPGWNVTVRTLLAFSLCALLAVGLTLVLSKLPFGRWVVGVGSRKAARPDRGKVNATA